MIQIKINDKGRLETCTLEQFIYHSDKEAFFESITESAQEADLQALKVALIEKDFCEFGRILAPLIRSDLATIHDQADGIVNLLPMDEISSFDPDYYR